MAITGLLSDFSLPELFQFLEQGQKSGLLTLKTIKGRKHLIWFRQGRIVAAANQDDHLGLLNLIQQRGWLGKEQDIQESDLQANPLGLYLKAKGQLQADQLKLLFYVQVMQQVCALFALTDAEFNFQPGVTTPALEMTGLSSPGIEVTLAGLRALKDWSVLASKLPDPNSALISRIEGKPTLHLNQLEWKVWEYVDGNISLKAIAQQLNTELDKIQQVAFRFIVVNISEELPLVVAPPEAPPPEIPGKNEAGLSQAFLENLMSFLQGKSNT
jgi:hypothetical protein